MHTLFIQLPVSESQRTSVKANVSLAAATLITYAKKHSKEKNHSYEILNQEICDYAGDARILKTVEDAKADIVAFSLYVWNIERSLYLAKKIKDRNPSCLLIAGGPEICKSTEIANNTLFDFRIEGSGEDAFVDILNNKIKKGFYTYEDPKELPESPYLSGELKFREDKLAFIETMRGCPNRCSYCYYGKRRKAILRFNEESVFKAITKACNEGAKEIYLMDPDALARPNPIEFLEKLEKANTKKLPIHTEVRLESISIEIAHKMMLAGIKSVEAGLQSTNLIALKNVHRSFNKEAFLYGAEQLKDFGIEIKTGLILGLPGDSLKHIKETIDFVRDNELVEGAELYPLSVLPGTELREKAEAFGITFMKESPYWILKTKDLSENDIYAALAYMEEEFEVEMHDAEAPYFVPNKAIKNQGLVCNLTIHTLDWAISNPRMLANCVSILCPNNESSLLKLYNSAFHLAEMNPFTIWQIIIETGHSLPEQAMTLAIQNAFKNKKCFYQKSRYYSFEFQNEFHARLFFMAENADEADLLFSVEEPWFDPILMPDHEMLSDYLDLFEGRPALALDRSKLSFNDLHTIVELYSGYENLVRELE